MGQYNHQKWNDLRNKKVTKFFFTINKVVPTLMELNEHLDEMKIKVWCYRNETRTICWEYEE